MKYTDDAFEVDKSEYGKLMNRLSSFQKETTPKKAIHMTLISANGIAKGKYASVFQNVITCEDWTAENATEYLRDFFER